MTHITIREQLTGETNAVLSIDHGEQYPISITDPLAKGEEALLEWYFEQHLRFPFTHQVRAQKAAERIKTYGEALFEQVFKDRRAWAAYQAALQAGVEHLAFEIEGSPEFHARHWEALKDPDLPEALALHAPMVRRNLKPRPMSAQLRGSPTVNILVVTARPDGARDVGYRTISRPLVEGLRQAGVPVHIEILRPGTYQALAEHLVTVRETHGTGYYHVVHFDVHGAVLSHEQLLKGVETDCWSFQQRYGRSDIAPYPGLKAFLFLEGSEDGRDKAKEPQKPTEPAKTSRRADPAEAQERAKRCEAVQPADPVEANELADLLITHQVPIVILNACQSGKQVKGEGEDGHPETRETSLGSRLMAAGVQTVLAMAYSVTVTAAELLMTTLYGRIFAGKDLSAAIRRGRLELHNRKGRRAYFNQTIDLEDWLLPVVYQSREQHIRTREFTPDEHAAYYERRARRYRSPNVTYGFVGRDLDILHTEKRLLTRRNLLLIRGMGGAGKTTLLHHLAEWWQTTGFVDRVWYFGYDERAWSRQQIMAAIARDLMSEVEYLKKFQPLQPASQQELLAERLRAERHLLILDNLESITGSHLAIRNTLPEQERTYLHDFLSEAAGGRTTVLLGSRGGEAWLAPGTFEDNVYELPGLDPEAASTLSDLILERHHATTYRTDKVHQKDLQRLLDLLAGYPLPMEVVLANLARQSPAEVLEALQAGDEKIDLRSENKTESILRCIDYSHSNLSPEAQQLLMCLAPFTSVINAAYLDQYTEELREQPALARLPFDRWEEVLQEAADWGLLSPHPDISGFLSLQPILPYFLRSRLAAAEHGETRAAIETAFRTHYDGMAGAIYTWFESKEPEDKQLGQDVAHLEYENLVTALNLALTAQVSMLDPYRVLSGYLDTTQDHRRGLELGETVLARLEAYPPDVLSGRLGAEFVGVLGSIAKRQLKTQQYAAAEASYRKALAIWLESKGHEPNEIRRGSASTYHQLGMVAQEQRQWAQAEQHYQQALQIYIEFNDRYSQASTYHNLGAVAQAQRQWAQAEQHYQQALQICIECKDRYDQARIYHQLGMVAQEQRQWQQAEQHYQQALQIKIEFDDRYSQASTYHNLGAVEQAQRQWEQAEQHYQQALQIFIEFNDRYSQASTYHQLGIVAQEQRQWEQAEQHYQQALQIYIEFNDRYSQAGTYHQLGRVAEEQRQWQQAAQHYQQALHIYIEFGDRYEQASTYHQLGIVAQEQRQWEQAKQHYQQALQIYIEFKDGYEQAGTYHQLGMVAEEQRQWEQAEQHYQQALHIYIEFGDRYEQASTYHQLGIVAQEQRQWEQAE
ncbi:MAG: tetratricopeptide repeat protein, partial [Thermodesulfobacteriota bacterium]